MVKIHLPPEHPRKELTPEEKAQLAQVQKEKDLDLALELLADILPSTHPKKAQLKTRINARKEVK